MEEALISLLLEDAGVSALVSDRINFQRRSQSESSMPAIVMHKISAPRDYNMSGPSNLIETRIQVDCFGEKYKSAKTLARAVVAVLNGFSGVKSGVSFQRISIDNERDTDGKESAADRYLFMTSLDLLIWHDE